MVACGSTAFCPLLRGEVSERDSGENSLSPIAPRCYVTRAGARPQGTAAAAPCLASAGATLPTVDCGCACLQSQQTFVLPTFSFAIPKKAADVELLMVQAGVHSAREPRRMFTKAASATAACSVRTTAPLTTPPSADHQYLPLALPVFSGALDGSCRNLLYAGPACGGVLVLRWLWLQGGGGRRRRAAAGGRRWKVEVEGGRWKVEGGRWKVEGGR